MKINIIFISNNSPILKGNLELVKRIISKYAKKAETLLPFKINNFTFTVYAWEKDWISSFTQAIDWVQININYKQLNKKMIDKLIYIIYHEMHHACRGYAGYLPENKEHILINSIISEGLADHFVLEQHDSKDVLENTSYDLSEISQWIKKLGKVLWNKEIADDSWIFGEKGKPKLLGYKIGRYIIQEVKERNPKLNSVNLVNATPEKILKLSGIKF
ncbi:MAG: DUF2268 domain-containing putative Zn-dependent protease [Nanoarchaeota archaeon]|nr:DUF2268 domain-containing putative Zn-dependent protease [Nanoarchaeota archaeon]